MKKKYIAPEAQSICFATGESIMISQSLPTGGGKDDVEFETEEYGWTDSANWSGGEE